MSWFIIFAAWVISFISTLGSLFFSDVMLLPPCILCWYQRICMYPLVVIFLLGLLKLDRSVFRYSFPLVLTGWGIAIYHNLLYYKLIPESASPCMKGISCTTVQLEWLGFITIPFLSLLGFSILLLLLILFRVKHED